MKNPVENPQNLEEAIGLGILAVMTIWLCV
jgi:hypothetical protein